MRILLSGLLFGNGFAIVYSASGAALSMLVMALLTIPALAKKKLTRAQGIGLLVIYAAFCVYQFAL